MNSIFLEQLHPTWEKFFNRRDIIHILTIIKQQVGEEFTPEPINLLRFAGMDLNKVKVIILGKDPYG